MIKNLSEISWFDFSMCWNKSISFAYDLSHPSAGHEKTFLSDVLTSPVHGDVGVAFMFSVALQLLQLRRFEASDPFLKAYPTVAPSRTAPAVGCPSSIRTMPPAPPTTNRCEVVPVHVDVTTLPSTSENFERLLPPLF